MSAHLPKAVGVIGKSGVEVPVGAALRGTFASKHPASVKFASVYRVLLLHRTDAGRCPLSRVALDTKYKFPGALAIVLSFRRRQPIEAAARH